MPLRSLLLCLLPLTALAAEPTPAPVPDPPPPPTWETLARAVLTEVAPDRLDQLVAGPAPAPTFDPRWELAPADAPARLMLLKALALARGTEDLAVTDAALAVAEQQPGQVWIEPGAVRVDLDLTAPLGEWRPALQFAWELSAELLQAAHPPPVPTLDRRLSHEATRAASVVNEAEHARAAWAPARAVVASLLPEAPLPDAVPLRLPLVAPHPQLDPNQHLSPAARHAVVRALHRAYLAEAAPELVRQAHKRAAGATPLTVGEPVCTSQQVLKPEQSLTTGLPPLLPTVRGVEKLFPKRELTFDGVFGAAGWRALFATWFGEELASLSTQGWTGDRVLLYHDPSAGTHVLLAFVTFADVPTATAFADRVRAWFKTTEIDGGALMHESTRVLFTRNLPEKELSRLVDRVWLTLELEPQRCGPRATTP